ncbi:Hypothetical predicted protein [Mytilus galloprovincialis]|uniref:Uncharacterized protein n=1 Tax=Mytilus galloprovincialis TaxID=29158 RepID=A0A8B6GKT9_MYTGA|nr:Hypothetical predicted protein [Mytilus galloprovincialis]
MEDRRSMQPTVMDLKKYRQYTASICSPSSTDEDGLLFRMRQHIQPIYVTFLDNEDAFMVYSTQKCVSGKYLVIVMMQLMRCLSCRRCSMAEEDVKLSRDETV